MANNLEKLKTGILMRSVQQQNNEPENIAIGQVSKKLRFLQRQSEYTREIIRVLEEMKITTKLIKKLNAGQERINGMKSKDLLLYYQGVFFDLVHQMKDKLLQLLNLMTETHPPQRLRGERNIKVKDILKKKDNKIKSLNIEDALSFWDQENLDSCVAVVLRKRTEHHHRVSMLSYEENVLNLNFVESMEIPRTKKLLSPYGIKRIREIKQESTKNLFTVTLKKTVETMKGIEDNLNEIAQALINYYKLPVHQEDIKRIYERHMKMLDSFEIKNQCSIEKISPTYKDKLKTAGELLKAHKDIIKAAYLIGSLGRGEYQEGYSDIGIIIVADKKNKVCIDALKKIFPRKRLVINIFTVDEFFSEKHKKDRFIIQTDGILLWGQDLVSKEKFPKPGLKLALLLNEDLLEKIEAAVTWIKSNPHVGPTEISIKSRTMAKDIINFIYGVVISNKPQFTHNRQERIQKINAMYPENKNTLDTLMQITKYGVGDMSSFITLTDGFKSRVLDNLKRMNFVCAELDKKSK